MKAVAAILSSLLLAGTTALPAQTLAQTAPFGIWRGTLDGVPSVTLTLADDTGELNGTIVFYAVDGEKKQAISIEPHMGIAPMFKDAATPEEGKYQTYVEFGKRLTKLLAEI